MIVGIVNGQTLRLQHPILAAKTHDYQEAEFRFQGTDWTGADVWAHFWRGEGEHLKVLLENGKAGKDKHLDFGEGEWKVYLEGKFPNGSIVTTVPAIMTVKPTGDLTGDGSLPEKPPTEFEQLVKQATDAKTGAETAQRGAEAAAQEAKAAADGVKDVSAQVEQVKGYTTRAETAAVSAGTQATNAAESAKEATNAAALAKADAAFVMQSATDAAEAAKSAKGSMDSAALSAQQAGRNAGIASQEAQAAEQAAVRAGEAASTAAGHADSSALAQQAAETAATTATASATTATEQATKATQQASKATTEADRAKQEADRASQNAGGLDLSITGATVGQYIKVKSVNPQGVPTAWEPVDAPSGGGGDLDWRLFQIATLEPGPVVYELNVEPGLKQLVVGLAGKFAPPDSIICHLVFKMMSGYPEGYADLLLLPYNPYRETFDRAKIVLNIDQSARIACGTLYYGTSSTKKVSGDVNVLDYAISGTIKSVTKSIALRFTCAEQTTITVHGGYDA